MSTVRFEPDGSVGLGAPAKHLAHSLFDGRQLPLETMLAGNYGQLSQELHESVYSRGRLLVHYLMFEPSRGGQLNRYGDLLAKGTAPLAAARTAFGDLKQLDRDLNFYLNRSKIAYLKLAAARFQTVPVAVRLLSEGAPKTILLRAQLKRGIPDDAADKFASQVSAVESRYRATSKNDTEDPQPLAMFFATYVMDGVRPTENAIDALHYASDLAPQDAGPRLSSALAYLNQGNLKQARATLIPIGYNPHETPLSQRAMTIIRAIDAGDARAALTTGQAPSPADSTLPSHRNHGGN